MKFNIKEWRDVHVKSPINEASDVTENLARIAKPFIEQLEEFRKEAMPAINKNYPQLKSNISKLQKLDSNITKAIGEYFKEVDKLVSDIEKLQKK